MKKYYKVIGADNKSCHGGDFDWTEYLPKGTTPGKWTPTVDNVVECQSGYHVTEYWNMWYKDGCRIFECEVDGVVMAEAAVKGVAGVVDKVVCKRIRLCKEIIPQFDNDYNTGDCNTGHNNTGHYNTGGCNTGGRNTGNYNTGNYNTGDWNACDRSAGFFNTRNDTIQVFNRPCKIEVWDDAVKPDFIFFALKGTIKESWRSAYDDASDEDKLRLVRLPNFDADVFYEISGILVDPKTGKEVLEAKKQKEN